MESDEPIRPGSYPPPRSAVVQLVLMLAAAAAVYLAATESQGATGIFFLASGALMVFVSPNRVLPWKYFVMGGGLVVLSALAMMPGGFWPMPEWRVWMGGFPAIPELPLVSVAPRETVYWMAVLSGAVAVGLFSLGHPVSADARVYLGLVGAAVCAGYTATALYAKATGWEYPFFDRGGFSPPDFGFFPNRNHTAAFLVTGSLLSLGLIRDAWSNRRPFVFLASIGTMGVSVYGLLFQSISRAGVVFLMAGVLLWVAMLGRRHMSVPLLVSSLVVGGVVAGLFLESEGAGRDRVLEMIGIGPRQEAGGRPENPEGRLDTAITDLRLRIFQDTVRLIRDYPLTGTGLGTYSYVYPFYARASLGEAAALHPESDWLMMVAESGIPFGLLAAALLWMLAGDLLRLRRGRNWAMRWGLACAVLVAVLHGIVDVPLHRVELGWWVLTLAGLAFGIPEQTHRKRDVSRMAQRVVLGVAGAVLLGFGFLLVRAEWFGRPAFPPFRAAAVWEQMKELAMAGKIPEAIRAGRAGLEQSPMARELYRELGYLGTLEGGRVEDADDFFAAERALYPPSAAVPRDQGRIWLGSDPSRTRHLWVEALRKHVVVAANGGHPDIVTYYDRILSEAQPYPRIFEALGRESGISPELQLVWITRSAGSGLEKASKDADFLKSLGPAGRRAFLRAWHSPASRGRVDAFLEANPDWEEAAWPVRVRQMESDQRYEELVRVAGARKKVELGLPELTTGELESSQPPYELAGQVAWYIARGNPVSARRVVAEAVEAGQLEGTRVQCALAIRSGNWEAAWRALDRYLRETRQADYL